MIVHIQTVMQSTFAIVGSDGEITETRTVATIATKLAQNEFYQALVHLLAAREELRQELAKGSG